MYQIWVAIGKKGKTFPVDDKGDRLFMRFVFTTWYHYKGKTRFSNHLVTLTSKGHIDYLNLIDEGSLMMIEGEVVPTYNKETKKSYTNIYVKQLKAYDVTKKVDPSTDIDTDELDMDIEF